ncbi:MAG: Rpn family recombination-promoting nuclease/putative transposase, partial [Puniceicoccales bacterium]|nr:Rpn family recombination-promoting nuclease/putative transposase [Puniceicoccales bacterium]
MNKRNLIRKLFLWGLCFGSLYQIGQASQAESQPAQHLQKELPHLALLKGKDSKTRDRLSKDQLTEILDPSYDATFKLLFKDSEKIGGHTGPERCKAFLNSIFYPGIDEEGFRIKELKMIDNERTKLGEVRGKKTRRLDIACQCTCWKGTDKPRNGKHVEKFDLEMQRTYDSNFMDRIESYGEDLREKKSMVSVKVLALYNFLENKEIPSVISKRVLKTLDTGKDQETRKGEPVIYLINLADQVKKMEAGEAIMIENKKLGEKGELWFALLGIRQWQENRKKNTVFPIVFKTEGFESQ